MMNQTRQYAHMMPIRAPGIGSMSGKATTRRGAWTCSLRKLQRNQGELRTTREEKPVCSSRKHSEEIGYGHLQVQGALDLSVRQILHIEIFDKERLRFSCAETHVQHQHRSSASNSTQQCCNAAHNGQVPLLRNLTCLHVIVGNGNDGSVVQDCDEDHCHHWEGKIPWNFVQIVLRLAFVQKPFITHDSLWVNTHCRQKEEHQKLQRARNTVDNVVFHPLEDLPRQVNGF